MHLMDLWLTLYNHRCRQLRKNLARLLYFSWFQVPSNKLACYTFLENINRRNGQAINRDSLLPRKRYFLTTNPGSVEHKVTFLCVSKAITFPCEYLKTQNGARKYLHVRNVVCKQVLRFIARCQRQPAARRII